MAPPLPVIGFRCLPTPETGSEAQPVPVTGSISQLVTLTSFKPLPFSLSMVLKLHQLM